MAWRIEFIPEAAKALEKLGAEAETRIARFLRNRISTLDNPRSLGKPLEGSRFAGLWRYQSGNYRILCEIQDTKIIILVVLVGHRREVYR